MEKNYSFNVKQFRQQLTTVLQAAAKLQLEGKLDANSLAKVLKRSPKEPGRLFSKQQLLAGYHALVEEKVIKAQPSLEAFFKMKPIRSISGVAPVTVLTMPFPCPGKCIFCPNDVRMPKSYLSDEPGAQRAARNMFDPYRQTYNRLLAFYKNGHQVAKIELLVLGGTWSFYPERYQVWFIAECFQAMQDFGKAMQSLVVADKPQNSITSEQEQPIWPQLDERRNYNKAAMAVAANFVPNASFLKQGKASATEWSALEELQKQNAAGVCRCVGMVLETRPDYLDETEAIRLRRLGATKIQLGYQFMDDKILELNKRGHDTASTRKAVAIARAAGFKIQAHWMPNLYGSTPKLDRQDFLKLFSAAFRPDELKIYPCSLVKTAELMDYYEAKQWRPYNARELSGLLKFCLENVPRTVRLSRVIRDIPSQDIVVGNRKSNLRQIVEKELAEHEKHSLDIRAREIKSRQVKAENLHVEITEYAAETSTGPAREIFIEYVDQSDRIAGFLRLCLPTQTGKSKHFIPELNDSALIREVHVYGVAQGLGSSSKQSAQHLGLGTLLIERAKELAAQAGYQKIAVISAIGTREYYAKRGFVLDKMYQIAKLND